MGSVKHRARHLTREAGLTHSCRPLSRHSEPITTSLRFLIDKLRCQRSSLIYLPPPSRSHRFDGCNDFYFPPRRRLGAAVVVVAALVVLPMILLAVLPSMSLSA
ncbi:hypothetical protein PIB30_022548 [Stylosanthes scabra]|uniref:Uncharacterized protein n=1 Tax=Stylosanthes scabra TaxID=79078 RepID=A0ABU6XAL2_9FABA|nr:hypothetical protein [Stylosanthes scabra]